MACSRRGGSRSSTSTRWAPGRPPPISAARWPASATTRSSPTRPRAPPVREGARPALRSRALVADEPARGARLQRALLDGYASLRELPDAHALHWHVAAAMLSERALRSVNRIRPEGLVHLGAVLADARASLRGEAVR